MSVFEEIAVVIPSYEPGEHFINLLDGIQKAGFLNIIIVNDGSSDKKYFEIAKNRFHCTVLTHYINLGKGRALKTAFNYILSDLPNCKGAVTVDSDGQHRVEDTIACAKAVLAYKDALIMGVRNFSSKNVPFKSKFGNTLTRQVMKIFCGVSTTDTQTGLRGFSRKLMADFMETKGERFEYETNMLLDTKEKDIRIVEIPIETIYIEGNESSHFNPLTDSLRIYALFLKFIFASASSFVIDILLFALFVSFTKSLLPATYILVSTVGARVISAFYNYLVNKNGVFKSKAGMGSTLVKYFILAVMQLSASAGLVTLFVKLFGLNETIVKVIVDLFLFIISFQIQREWVFKETKKKA